MLDDVTKEPKLALVMSSWIRSGYDFIGKYKGSDDCYIYLEDPLTLEYGSYNSDDTKPKTLERLGPYHLPLGKVDSFGKSNVLCLLHDYVGYLTLLPAEGDDWIHKQYYAFFEQAE